MQERREVVYPRESGGVRRGYITVFDLCGTLR